MIIYLLRLYRYRYDIGIGIDIYNIGIGLLIVRYKLQDFKCDYGAIFLDKLCYTVSNGFYEWCIIANRSCR